MRAKGREEVCVGSKDERVKGYGMGESGGKVGHTAEGGCRCGSIRLRATGKPSTVVYCHCVDCRRSSGSPVSLFAGYRTGQVEMERGALKAYASSPGVVRSFCAGCGTQISYEDEWLEGEVYVHVGVFDDPERFEPEVHDWVSQKPAWLAINDDLPKYQESSIPR